jgi:predicted HicB family RNase H-like nuclease
MKNLVDKYTYRVEWSQEDQSHIATCLELPSLSAHGSAPEKALAEIRKVVRASLKWMQEAGEEHPEPLSTRAYSGKFNVRVPPDVHKELVITAAEQNVSLNQLILIRISRGRKITEYSGEF